MQLLINRSNMLILCVLLPFAFKAFLKYLHGDIRDSLIDVTDLIRT